MLRIGYFCRAMTLLILALLLQDAAHAKAGFVFIGPSAYVSKTDSPFPINGSNPTFTLEDFEDDPGCVPGEFTFCGGGKFDAPGVRMIYGSTGHGLSVDADDGAIDGSGANGASATATSVYLTPYSIFVAIQLEFDANPLGHLPTAVGVVLTDGTGYLSGVSVYDADGNVSYFDTSNINLDPQTTSDDRFIGMTNERGISKLQFGKTILNSAPSNLPRLDHLQFGFLVPEPGSLTLVILSGLAILLRDPFQMVRESRKLKKGLVQHVLEETIAE